MVEWWWIPIAVMLSAQATVSWCAILAAIDGTKA